MEGRWREPPVAPPCEKTPTLQELAPDYTWAIYMLCFVIGYTMTLPLLEIVQAVVCALFICFAREPDVLQKARPHLYKEIVRRAGAWQRGERGGREVGGHHQEAGRESAEERSHGEIRRLEALACDKPHIDQHQRREICPFGQPIPS
jgi:hypothetical protein